MMNLYFKFRIRLALAVAGWLNRLLPDECPGPVAAVVMGQVFQGKEGNLTIHIIDHNFVQYLSEEEVKQMFGQMEEAQQQDFAEQMQEEYGYKPEEPVKMLN